jgi:hypothetical protein
MEEVFINNEAILLRLNPIENIWSKVTSHVKKHLGIPNVVPPRLGKQRLKYLENLTHQHLLIMR